MNREQLLKKHKDLKDFIKELEITLDKLVDSNTPDYLVGKLELQRQDRIKELKELEISINNQG